MSFAPFHAFNKTVAAMLGEKIEPDEADLVEAVRTTFASVRTDPATQMALAAVATLADADAEAP